MFSSSVANSASSSPADPSVWLLSTVLRTWRSVSLTARRVAEFVPATSPRQHSYVVRAESLQRFSRQAKDRARNILTGQKRDSFVAHGDCSGRSDPVSDFVRKALRLWWVCAQMGRQFAGRGAEQPDVDVAARAWKRELERSVMLYTLLEWRALCIRRAPKDLAAGQFSSRCDSLILAVLLSWRCMTLETYRSGGHARTSHISSATTQQPREAKVLGRVVAALLRAFQQEMLRSAWAAWKEAAHCENRQRCQELQSHAEQLRADAEYTVKQAVEAVDRLRQRVPLYSLFFGWLCVVCSSSFLKEGLGRALTLRRVDVETALLARAYSAWMLLASMLRPSMLPRSMLMRRPMLVLLHRRKGMFFQDIATSAWLWKMWCTSWKACQPAAQSFRPIRPVSRNVAMELLWLTQNILIVMLLMRHPWNACGKNWRVPMKQHRGNCDWVAGRCFQSMSASKFARSSGMQGGLHALHMRISKSRCTRSGVVIMQLGGEK